jgi:hypothetical protein
MTHTPPPTGPAAKGTARVVQSGPVLWPYAAAAGPPPAGPVPPAGRVRARLLPVLLIALVAGLVTSAAAGAGGFLIGRSTADPYGPAGCGSGALQCIPTLDVATVATALQDRGFECPSEPSGGGSGTVWNCELRQGSHEYLAVIYSQGALIQEYSATVGYDPALGISPAAMGFLGWFVILPFGLDPEAEAAATDWLTEGAGAGSAETAEIRGYRFDLSGSANGGMTLYMAGGYE